MNRLLLFRRRQRYLLRDEFTTDLAAGAVNGTPAEDGPGIRTVTDTDSKLSISGGALNLASHSTPAWGDPGLWYNAVARAMGRLLKVQIYLNQATGKTVVGYDVNQSGVINAQALYFTNSGTIRTYESALLVTVGAYSASTEYLCAVLFRTSGSYYFIKGGAFTNWEMLWSSGVNATASLYPGISWGDAAGSGTFSYIRLPDDLWLPTPSAYDSFGRANGALGSSEANGPDGQATPARVWTGATWAVDTNQAKNTPTETEISPDNNAASDSQTEANATTGYAFGGGGSGASDGTQQQSGSYSLKVDGAASPSMRELSSVMTIGLWYSLSYYYFVEGGDTITSIVNRSGEDGSFVFVEVSPVIGTWTQALVVFRADHSNPAQGWVRWNITNISDAIYFDNIQHKAITLSSLFSSLESLTADVLIDVDIVVSPAGTLAGIVMNLDDAATPANFVIAYHDGTNAKLDKCVAGTYTSVISAAAAFSAGATLRVVKDGTSYSLYYNNAQVGTTQTVSDAGIVDNTIHGMFSTLAANRLDNFQVFPRGTNGEYNRLDKF